MLSSFNKSLFFLPNHCSHFFLGVEAFCLLSIVAHTLIFAGFPSLSLPITHSFAFSFFHYLCCNTSRGCISFSLLPNLLSLAIAFFISMLQHILGVHLFPSLTIVFSFFLAFLLQCIPRVCSLSPLCQISLYP